MPATLRPEPRSLNADPGPCSLLFHNCFPRSVSKQTMNRGKPMSRFAVPAMAGILALGFFAVAQPIHAQSAAFTVALNGKNIGTASYEYVATPEGYRSTSIVRVSMQGLDYSLSKSEQLSPARDFEHVRLNAVVSEDAVTS